MRILVFVLVVAGAVSLPTGQQSIVLSGDIISTLINTTLEYTIRPLIPEPIVVEHVEVQLPENPYVNGSTTMTNWILSGINSFQLQKLAIDLDTAKATFVLVFPKITLNTTYTGHLFVDGVDTEVIGDGFFSGTVSGVEIVASGAADFSLGIQVSRLAARVTLEGATFLIDDSADPERGEQLTDFLNQNAVNLVDENVVQIGEDISPIIEKVLNYLLSILFPAKTKIDLF